MLTNRWSQVVVYYVGLNSGPIYERFLPFSDLPFSEQLHSTNPATQEHRTSLRPSKAQNLC